MKVWNGETSIPKENKKSNVKVSQPLSDLPPQVHTNAALPPPTVAPNAAQQALPQNQMRKISMNVPTIGTNGCK